MGLFFPGLGGAPLTLVMNYQTNGIHAGAARNYRSRTSAANDPVFRKVPLKVAVDFIPEGGVRYRLPTPVQTKKKPSEP
jgi:hypothetical protein